MSGRRSRESPEADFSIGNEAKIRLLTSAATAEDAFRMTCSCRCRWFDGAGPQEFQGALYVPYAVEILTADLSRPFERYPARDDTVRDRRNGVLINLLPAGQSYKSACKVPFPHPTDLSDIPQFVSLAKLVSLKLDSWVNTPVRRLKDKTDVIELIKLLHLPRHLSVDEPVRHLYEQTWDALAAERNRSSRGLPQMEKPPAIVVAGGCEGEAYRRTRKNI